MNIVARLSATGTEPNVFPYTSIQEEPSGIQKAHFCTSQTNEGGAMFKWNVASWQSSSIPALEMFRRSTWVTHIPSPSALLTYFAL